MISEHGCRAVKTVKVQDVESGTIFRSFDSPSNSIYLRTPEGAVLIHNKENYNLGMCLDDKQLYDFECFLDCLICPPGETVTLSNG